MRPIQDVKPEIAALREIRAKVFGDDNHAAIDAQIAVLTYDMDWEVIGGQYGHDDNQYSAAGAARAWLDGDTPDAPSSDWASLAGV